MAQLPFGLLIQKGRPAQTVQAGFGWGPGHTVLGLPIQISAVGPPDAGVGAEEKGGPPVGPARELPGLRLVCLSQRGRACFVCLEQSAEQPYAAGRQQNKAQDGQQLFSVHQRFPGWGKVLTCGGLTGQAFQKVRVGVPASGGDPAQKRCHGGQQNVFRQPGQQGQRQGQDGNRQTEVDRFYRSLRPAQHCRAAEQKAQRGQSRQRTGAAHQVRRLLIHGRSLPQYLHQKDLQESGPDGQRQRNRKHGVRVPDDAKGGGKDGVNLAE